MEKVLAIDIGGTSVKIGVVDGQSVIEKTSMRNQFKGNQDQLVKGIKTICDDYINKYSINKIGIGCPGEIIDNTVTVASNLGWKNFPIVEAFSNAFPNLKVFVDNDGNAACLAERLYGKLQNCNNCIFITIGRGIGGQIIYDGKTINGSHNLGGRIGHMVIRSNGRKCNCGRRGCFETYASVYGLIRTIRDTNHHWPIESEKIEDSELSGFQVAKYKNSNNQIINAGVYHWLDDLADGILNLCHIFDPEIVVIAGGITESNLIDKEYLQKKFADLGFSKCEIHISQFKGKAGMIGAAALTNKED